MLAVVSLPTFAASTRTLRRCRSLSLEDSNCTMATPQIELQRFEDAHQTSGVWQDQQMSSDAEVELESPNPDAPHGFSLPPVDRGKDAWLFLAASFVIEALVWGMPY